MTQEIRFDNGASYERYMGVWSQRAGEAFLDWLALPRGLAWLDVGCGNGAFTERMAERMGPASIAGIDPAAGMLEFARARQSLAGADIRQGDAMALPFRSGSFDVAVMPLVIFFVPDPAKGVAEMARVLRPGGTAAAYAWDMDGGGFPYDLLHRTLEALGANPPKAPSMDASRLEEMARLWREAGFGAIETRQINVQRSFADFDDYWATVEGGPSVAGTLASLSPSDLEMLRQQLRAKLTTDASGRISCLACANAVKGTLPATR